MKASLAFSSPCQKPEFWSTEIAVQGRRFGCSSEQCWARDIDEAAQEPAVVAFDAILARVCHLPSR